MFSGYYSREYDGFSIVGYHDKYGAWVPIQKFFNPDIDQEFRRKLFDATCPESQETDPRSAGRNLVSLLNGGRDFHRVAGAAEMHTELLREVIQGIKDLTDAVHRVANVVEGT